MCPKTGQTWWVPPEHSRGGSGDRAPEGGDEAAIREGGDGGPGRVDGGKDGDESGDEDNGAAPRLSQSADEGKVESNDRPGSQGNLEDDQGLVPTQLVPTQAEWGTYASPCSLFLTPAL